MATVHEHFDAKTAELHALTLQAAAGRAGLSLLSLIGLLVRFGPQIVPILGDVLGAFAGGFDWTKILPLLQKDGPLVIALVQAIAAALGQTVPTPPTLPVTP